MTDNSRKSTFGRLIRVDPTGKVTQQRTMTTVRTRPIALTQRRSGLPIEVVEDWKVSTPQIPHQNFVNLLKSIKTTDPTTQHVVNEMITALSRSQSIEWIPYVYRGSYTTIGSKTTLEGETITCQVGLAGLSTENPIIYPFGPEIKNLLPEPVSLEWISDQNEKIGTVEGMWADNGTITVDRVMRGEKEIPWSEMELPLTLKFSGKIPLIT